jgi:hypothetical protein
LIFSTGVRVGGFDPARYRQQLVRNTDFRKFDDGLRMTLDCTPEIADRVEAVLASARASGIGRYGVHRQTAALMTCFVPSPTRSDHGIGPAEVRERYGWNPIRFRTSLP